MTTVDETPKGYPDAAEDQMQWLINLAEQVVDFLWMPPAQEDIRLASSTKWVEEDPSEPIFPFCTCEEGNCM